MTALSAKQDVTIIGGSLSGLTLALACAHRGIGVRVLEQALGPRLRGGTLGIDRNLLLNTIGREAPHENMHAPFPILAGRRQAVAWRVIYGWLRAEAQRYPAITLEDGVAVVKIEQDRDEVTAISSDARRFRSNLIVGADGYRSLVRRAVNPEEDEAVYAGYLLWRGLVDEAELPSNRLPREHEEAVLINETGHRLVTYAVAGADGTLELGRRLLSFTWYDAGYDDLLRKLSCVSDSGCVLRTLTEEQIPAEVRTDMCELASRIWPDPWRSVIIHALERQLVFATPVAEYHPRRLCKGSLAIIGDAAHALSPISGQGFVAGVRDAAALAESLADANDSPDQNVRAALSLYEKRRLAEVQTLVLDSQKWSKAFVEKGLAFASEHSS